MLIEAEHNLDILQRWTSVLVGFVSPLCSRPGTCESAMPAGEVQPDLPRTCG